MEAGHEDDVAVLLEADAALGRRSRRETSPETAVDAAASASESSMIESPGYRSGPGSSSRSASTTLGSPDRSRAAFEAVGAPLSALGPLAELRDLGRFSSCISRSSDRVHHAAEEAAEAFALAARPGRVAALLPYIDCLYLHDAAVVVEAHEDALALEAADFATLAIERAGA